jgi:serine/threonine-protein kinase
VPLPAGQRIGPYEVRSLLGAGGMGEVYRARDTKLNRDVAIKVLPDVVTHDPTRVARFAREAQVLASLNHPNIGAIYGLEDGHGATALVLELIEGPTLADRIGGTAIPIDEAVAIARQVADALAAAHEVGIVHRDLKPANIKVRRDGTVKVLDFGLAKALDPTLSSSEVSQSPTLTHADISHVGAIVGTAAYMAPEQAAGRAADRRSDIWSFGVVLMEMLTGRRVFTGETASHVLAAVLREEPDFSTLPPDTPAAIRRLLRRCLQKEPRRRLDSAAAVALDLDEVARPDPSDVQRVASPVPLRSRWPYAAAAALVGALVAGAAVWAMIGRGGESAAPPVNRFAIPTTADLPFQPSLQAAARDFAVAPDGSFLVYRTAGRRLVLRRFDQLELKLLDNIEEAAMPFVSPDGRWIGFVQNDLMLMKVAVTGGAPVTLARLPVWPRGGAWVDDSTILIGTNSPATGVLRVPAGGGEPSVLTTPDRSKGEEGHVLPFGLPGAKAALFTIGAADPKDSQVAVLDLQTRQYKVVLKGGRDAQYLPSGHLLFQSGLGMSAVRFDLATLSVVGEPVRILDNLAVAPTGALNAAATSAGTLLYAPPAMAAAVPRTLVWIDRSGRETPVGAPPRAYESVRLSPDGTNAVVGVRDQQNDVWMWSFARQTLTRLTFDADVDVSPVWTPDGHRVVFSSARAGVYNLYTLDINRPGSDRRMTRSANTQLPDSVTPDGAFVISHEVRPQTKSDIGRVSLAPAPDGDAKSESLIQGPVEEWNGEVSPDARLLAFQFFESKDNEIYVSPYPDVASGRWQLTSGGGSAPAWTRNGRELIYLDGSRHLTAVMLERTGGEVRALARTTLSDRIYAAPVPWRTYDVSPDGQRIIAIRDEQAAQEGAPPQFTVVQNWFEELRRMLPVTR